MALDGKNAITRALERNPEATLLALTKGAKPLPIESLERPYSPKTGEFHTPPECNLYVEVAQLLAGPDHGGAQLLACRGEATNFSFARQGFDRSAS